MKFSQVAERFNEMSATTKRLELTDILVKLLGNAEEELKKLVYLIQGQLVPDYEGIELGMSSKLMIRALSIISDTTEVEIETMYVKEGDLGTVAKIILQNKLQSSLFGTELTVGRVYDELTKLANYSGKGSQSNKIGIYRDLLLNSNPDEGMYITRIISGKLRLGVSDATILDALILAFDNKENSDIIDEAYNYHPDMGLMAELLKENRIDEVKKMGPTLMIPAKVMLAERLPEIGDVLEKMGGEAAFEYKYDGMRTQIHKDGDNVRIFSRGSEETTSFFPDIVEYTKKTFKCSSCIIDGEAVPYNTKTGQLYPFQAVSQRRGRKYDLKVMVQEVPLVVFLFDVIYLNGEPVHKKPYLERKKILESMFKENDHFRYAKTLVSSNKKEIEKFFNESVEAGSEGLVAKNISPESIYRAGARGWLWVKLKLDYRSTYKDTLDLVVVGAFGGQGRRAGTYGALLMAAYNQGNDTFESICKLGTGFNDEVLFNLPERLADYKVDQKPARVESGMEPEVWFEPAQVLEIIGPEITVSPIHKCGFGQVEKDAGLAIRFPRFTGRFRDDKKAEDATSTVEIIEMYYGQKKVG